MIKLSGTLTIRIRESRYGAFSVGQLLTEIGEFAVKDSMFDQYEEGRYEGDFVISKIYNGSYTISNRVISQVCADINSVELSTADVEEQAEEAFVQDPIEKEQSLSTHEASSRDESTAASLKDDSTSVKDESSETIGNDESDLGYESTTDADSEMRDLFGLLWPLGQRVKIDSTVDRKLIRQQRDKLNELGYTFQAVGQVWLKTN